MITPCIPKLLQKKLLFFFTVYKNEWKKHNFWRQKNKISNFSKKIKLNTIGDTDVNKILISKKEPYGIKNSFNYFTGYNDNNVIRPLCVKLPQMTSYARKFDENATISFRVSNKNF